MRATVVRFAFGASLLLLGVSPAGAHPGGGDPASCGGTAPTKTACTTYTHTYLTEVQNSLSWSTVYTGSLEGRLEWQVAGLLQARVLRCNISGGQETCVMNGMWPPPLVSFTHRCVSYVLGSYSTTGGSGVWQCAVSHDGLPVASSRVSDVLR